MRISRNKALGDTKINSGLFTQKRLIFPEGKNRFGEVPDKTINDEMSPIWR